MFIELCILDFYKLEYMNIGMVWFCLEETTERDKYYCFSYLVVTFGIFGNI